MPRAQAIFEIVEPEIPGTGPVFAEADSIFSDSDIPHDERRIPMPDEVDGIPLAAGMKVQGFGQIFVKSALGVRPHDLHIVTDTPEEKRTPPVSVYWD